MNTPRTDRVATTIKDYFGYDEVVPADVCRDTECELAELQLKFMDQSSEVLELRKDKERLDWLLSTQSWYSDNGLGTRQQIDKAMEDEWFERQRHDKIMSGMDAEDKL